MTKRLIEPNTTLYPVAVVLISAGVTAPNVMTCNRIASCSAEPPRLCISVRPTRHSHALIRETREFVVNIPLISQQILTDYLGVVSGKVEDKIEVAGLRLEAASVVRTPLLADCPVNIECVVEHELELDSHTMFIGLVKAVHAEESLLDTKGDVDLERALGIVYDSGVVRERPTSDFKVDDLRRAVQAP